MTNALLDLGDFQADLLTWFDSWARKYPWRKTKNAFHILIAEKLLQQTRATDAVVNAYTTLISKYPQPDQLADANLREIRKIVKPLGLSFRAKQLILMSKDLLEKHNGRVPQDYNELMSLTGVGEYSARAVLSFAFDKDYAVIDINVGRLLFRLFNIKKEFPANPSRKRYLVELAQSILPYGKSRDFNFAILDLCALVCKHPRPDCLHCPVQIYCQYDKKYFGVVG